MRCAESLTDAPHQDEKWAAAAAPTIPGAGKEGESISHWSSSWNVEVGITCWPTGILITADLYGYLLIFLLMSNLLICSLVLKGKQEKEKGVLLVSAALRGAKEQSRFKQYIVAKAKIKLFKLFTLKLHTGKGNFYSDLKPSCSLAHWNPSALPFRGPHYYFSCLTSPE